MINDGGNGCTMKKRKHKSSKPLAGAKRPKEKPLYPFAKKRVKALCREARRLALLLKKKNVRGFKQVGKTEIAEILIVFERLPSKDDPKCIKLSITTDNRHITSASKWKAEWNPRRTMSPL